MRFVPTHCLHLKILNTDMVFEVFCEYLKIKVKTGAPREIRTPDPLIRSQVLYPTELWARPGL